MITEMLIRHEGMRLKPYKCPAGRWTFGVGRNIQDNGITEEEALFLLRNDIKRCDEELKGYGFYQHLNEARKAALLDMLFNLGLPRFSKFKNMLAALTAQNWDLAADEMLESRWARQVGYRAEELAEMVRSGNEF